MIKNRRSLRKDTRAFTGLEAAIVLTAFIVVAAVFSYMVLGAGFFSTEKAKAVVHSGVEQATSSAELVGDVVGRDTGGNSLINYINFTVQLTAGQNPMDLDEASIAFTNATTHNDSTVWTYTMFECLESPCDNMLEPSEKAEIQVSLPVELGTYNKFLLEFKPQSGGVLCIEKTTPGAIQPVTRLY